MAKCLNCGENYTPNFSQYLSNYEAELKTRKHKKEINLKNNFDWGCNWEKQC